ncbi:MAG: hypothetical protein JWP36_1285 [Paucimonas sp.]|jgi:hypothetical protein|nr:hypothetical protein [Paucimonas sp.]
MRRFLYPVNFFVSLFFRCDTKLTDLHPCRVLHFWHSLALRFECRFATGGELYQRFWNRGKRFSKKAFMPSFRSSVAKVEWNIRRSKSMPSASVDS